MSSSVDSSRVGPGELGQRLRRAREQQGISLRTLAKRIDVSASLISQVERGNVTPSVGTLYAIVRELDLSLDELFSDAESRDGGARRQEAGPVQRGDRRKTIYLASGVHWELLTVTHDSDLEFQITSYDVGAESCPPDALMTHGGKEYGYVISGRLDVTIGPDTYTLDPGDSVSFSSMTPHRLANGGDVPVQALWVVVGRELDTRLAISSRH